MIGLHGIRIGSHIRRIYDIVDASFDPAALDIGELKKLSQSPFPVLEAPVIREDD